MPLKLVDKKATYEISMPIKGDEEKDYPVFVMRFLGSEEVNRMEDKLLMTRENDERLSILTGTQNYMKLELAVVDWKKVFSSSGEPVPCTSENKKQLPAFVQAFLVEHINEINGLNKSEKRKGYEKN